MGPSADWLYPRGTGHAASLLYIFTFKATKIRNVYKLKEN